jgi:glycosyltransferase involved in cell wall biosynthesis
MTTRIHISYSDKHFRPDRKQPDTAWYSCSQLAMHMWQALSARYPGTTYGDAVPDEPLDLLWTNRLNNWKPSLKRMATFASVGHYAYVAQQVRRARASVSRGPIEGLYTVKDRWQHWLTLARSNLILAIGNRRIADSFALQSPRGALQVVNSGVHTAHFAPMDGFERAPVFIHNATRFSVRKGSHLVAQAWRRVVARLPAARLVLLGRDGDVDMVSQLHGIANVVAGGAYVSGSREYIERLSSARWVVLPSLAEGQAGTLLEAMSCGCVPLASRDTGVDADAYGGYVLEPNSADALADAMLRAAAAWTPAQAARVRRETEARHAWAAFDTSFVACTERLLAAAPPPPPAPSRILAGFLWHLARENAGLQ